MKRLYLLLSFSLLFLSSCDLIDAIFSKPESPAGEIPLTDEMKKNRCVKHEFRQGQAENLYGIECLEEKRIFIQTHSSGNPIDPISKTEAGKNLRLEKKDDNTGKTEEVNFIPNVINKFYKVGYTVQKDQGDDKEYPFLRDLLPENERFYGSLGKTYHIVFKVEGNYLILYKASKNIEDIPYTQRTTLPKSSEGIYKKSEDGYYRVPFIGYQIGYCKTEREIHQTGQTGRYETIINCSINNRAGNPYYIQFQTDNKQPFTYKNKMNVFPAKYFTEGLWFYSEGDVETASIEAHSYISRAFLVKLEAKDSALGLVDVSGNISDLNQRRKDLFSVEWKEYSMDKTDGVIFKNFQEKEDIDNSPEKIERPYVQINFNLKKSDEITDLVITKNYFSYVKSFTDDTGKRKKVKTSLLRESAVNQKGFFQKRWFKDDQDHRFGVLPVSPQTEEKPGVFELEEKTKAFRLIHFHTNKKETIIKWHFSNYTVANGKEGIADNEGDFYRDIGQEAVDIWNRAFQIITRDSGKTIRVKLADKEGDKDLGDLRYNILNLVKVTTLRGQRSSLAGIAPSFIKADTGQIVGTTSNVFIHNISKIYEKYVADYIRYEIFRKDQNSICSDGESKKTVEEEANNHGVSPYIRSLIEGHCQGVKDFICSKKEKIKAGKIKLTPRDNLKDSKEIISCERKISRDYVLQTILHEMGHSFGLGHNFKASTDEKNYYQSLEEMKTYFPMARSTKIPKTSSIMDYTPDYVPPMTILGKYDLAALRYLYMNQLEKSDGILLTLKIPEDPEQQQPLERLLGRENLSLLKNYAHCGDAINNNSIPYFEKPFPNFEKPLLKKLDYVLKPNAEDFLCLTHDYGSNPLEIVQSDIEEFKRKMRASRYSYAEYKLIYSLLYRRILGFYNKWIFLRNEYLRSIGQLSKSFSLFNDKASIEEYKILIEKTKNMEEFALYYPIREIIFNFIKDIIFLKTMKCKVQDDENKVWYLDLNFIKNKLLFRDLYVEDCQSEHIQDFFDNNNLTYLDQTGVENFSSYYSQGIDDDRKDLISVSDLLNFLYSDSEKVNKILHKINLNNSTLNFMNFIQEPDFLSNFFDRLKKEFLIDKESGVSGSDLKHLFGLLSNSYRYLYRLQSIAPDSLAQFILWNNRNQFVSIKYTIGSYGEKSFYKRVLEPFRIASAREIFGNINIPFLTKAFFQDYLPLFPQKKLDMRDIILFQTYMMNRKDTLTDSQNFVFRMPFAPETFIEEVIVKHNENLVKLKIMGCENKEELIVQYNKSPLMDLKSLKCKKSEEDLTILEEMEKESLEIHNHYLKKATSVVEDLFSEK